MKLSRRMDLVLDAADRYLLTPHVFPTWLPEDDWRRQTLSLYVITVVGGAALYLFSAALSYYTLFDHRLKKHPLFLKNQIRLEMKTALSSIPLMALYTIPVFVLEVRGYSRLYMGIEGWTGWLAIAVSACAFIIFTDCFIYWIHRCLHHPLVYKNVHKTHHRWKIPTPFASHAFHPLDGFLQSCPYHIYPFLFPLHKVLYLGLFMVVNVWTVSIHDGDYRVPDTLQPFVNGAAHHTDHHLFYNYNYGQFFTLWDRIGRSYRYPSAFEGESPLSVLLHQSATSTKRKREWTEDTMNTVTANGVAHNCNKSK